MITALVISIVYFVLIVTVVVFMHGAADADHLEI